MTHPHCHSNNKKHIYNSIFFFFPFEDDLCQPDGISLVFRVRRKFTKQHGIFSTAIVLILCSYVYPSILWFLFSSKLLCACACVRCRRLKDSIKKYFIGLPHHHGAGLTVFITCTNQATLGGLLHSFQIFHPSCKSW